MVTSGDTQVMYQPGDTVQYMRHRIHGEVGSHIGAYAEVIEQYSDGKVYARYWDVPGRPTALFYPDEIVKAETL